MLRYHQGTSTEHSRPFTHRDCIAASRRTADAAAPPPAGPWVQVRRYTRGGPYVLCGKVIELDSHSGEWFKVATDADGAVWTQGRNLRLCSGDGRCTCEPDQAANRRDDCEARTC